MSNPPRLLLCAPASGGGKTTMTCAILQALMNRNADPVAFKCGPDYIDPMFHREVIGAHSRNLDLFLLGEETTKRLLWENAQGHGPAIIEGVMGYYDGVGLSSEASAYALAKSTSTPAVLVADVRGRALSAAAMIKGFLSFRPNSGIQGVLLNRISPMLYPRLKQVIELECGILVYGYLPERVDCALESRHLGLVTATEVLDLKEKLTKLAQQVEETVDLDGLLALAQSAPSLNTLKPKLPKRVTGRPRIAVARDRAFCFYYADSLALLETLGAELVPFSPLEDKYLPADICGLYLGGGYPELYAQALSENETMRIAVQSILEREMPCVAECGGFLYLHTALEDRLGKIWPMVGMISGTAFPTGKLSRFGYVTLTAEKENLFCEQGETLPAHEFHYWDSPDPGHDFYAKKPQSERGWPCIHGGNTSYFGFPHLHFRARPQAAARFVMACMRYKEMQS